MIKTILIVDDHNVFRKELKKFIEKQRFNFEIYEANSEKTAVASAARIKPDIVLLELQLPKMNGIKTSRLIKNMSPKSKIIIVTTFDSEVFKNQFINAHIDEFIGKSEFDSKLIKVLKKYLKGNNRAGKFIKTRPAQKANTANCLRKNMALARTEYIREVL